MTLKETLICTGDKIRRIREQKGISQRTLGRHIGEDIFYIQQLELGLIDPNMADLCTLIFELDVPLSEFFSDFE